LPKEAIHDPSSYYQKRNEWRKEKKILTVNMELVKCLGVQLLLAQVVAATSMY
jgi:hypothetical protein